MIAIVTCCHFFIKRVRTGLCLCLQLRLYHVWWQCIFQDFEFGFINRVSGGGGQHLL